MITRESRRSRQTHKANLTKRTDGQCSEDNLAAKITPTRAAAGTACIGDNEWKERRKSDRPGRQSGGQVRRTVRPFRPGASQVTTVVTLTPPLVTVARIPALCAPSSPTRATAAMPVFSLGHLPPLTLVNATSKRSWPQCQSGVQCSFPRLLRCGNFVGGGVVTPGS